jgi:TrmH family RNA methyltransferase
VLTSTANPLVREARQLGRSHRARAGGTFLVEGPQAVREAGAALTHLFVTGGAAAAHPGLVGDARRHGARVVEVSDAVLAAIAGTVSPQGLVGVAHLPFPPLGRALSGATLAVVLADVRDPGNVGTAIRTADAAGADAVVLSRGSADARSPKAVRASTGSIFHLPVTSDADLDDVLVSARERGLQLLATSPRAALPYDEADLTRPIALVFGNEARGLSDEIVARCDGAVRIPLHGRAESLNLAATVAVLVYEAARQRRRRESDAP